MFGIMCSKLSTHMSSITQTGTKHNFNLQYKHKLNTHSIKYSIQSAILYSRDFITKMVKRRKQRKRLILAYIYLISLLKH